MVRLSEEFLATMAPVFVDRLSAVNGQLEPDSAPSNNFYQLERELVGLVGGIAWSKEIADRMPINPDDYQISPNHHARLLTQQAFSDARYIVKLCTDQRQAVADRGLHFGSTLLNSANLVTISFLPEMSKSNLFNSIEKQATLGNITDTAIACPILIKEAGEDSRFEWHDEIKQWIRKSMQPGSGCPANHFFVEGEDSHRRPLTRYFWHKLIEASFAAQP